MTMKPDLMMKLLLAAVGLLLGLNLVASTAGPALAARDEGPVGTYQISSYVVPPTDTRPNYIRGYFIVDTRTGEVDYEEKTVW
ncbi:MAG: hypothetical protein KBA64_03425 [Armatimonadetes bacterium]|jgi:hypothetical protein|nr:hypothetical protein [Armatimonadota bacterium]MDI9603669.1 hypothetical protein [Acidobacteriota bacterium]NLN90515.1 hypothetical protein [candidate division WS1 bacterium]